MKSFVKNSGLITMMLFIAFSVGCSASERSNPRIPEEIVTKEAVESMNMNPQADSGTEEFSQAGERMDLILCTPLRCISKDRKFLKHFAINLPKR
ncbi:hypothetical protein [Paenibacillus sp. EZ-K15]|uniref:hypothetical protein n=1 Tax=Paenibacillus sp. EZ-K15 TaxID=2044275 RepID=UPI000BF70DFD|nr:hypothetical protein [Paenibacillus sp. EZ-K15]